MRKKLRLTSQHFVFPVFGLTIVLLILVSKDLRPQQVNEDPECLSKTLKGPLKYDDPYLVKHIKNKVLVPPSTKKYDLLSKFVNQTLDFSGEILYHNFIRSMFNSTENGFFVEAGALDGESMSNTLWLEQAKGWSGLLVEPDPFNFNMLLTKHRKAWSANACLSIEKYPIMETLSSVDVLNNQDVRDRAMGSIIGVPGAITGLTSDHVYNSYYKSQCYPLGSLLLALNVTRIDLLSLDVEFVEEKILRNFDFEKFDVQVMLIEFYDFTSKYKLHEYLLSKGFEFVIEAHADMIYCKKGTDLANKLSVLYPKRFINMALPKIAVVRP